MKTKLNRGTNSFIKISLLFTMRIFIFIFSLVSFGFNMENGFSQNEKITFEEDVKLTIEEVFEVVKKQTDYNFIYRSDLFVNVSSINIKKGTIKVSELFNKCVSVANFDVQFGQNGSIYIKEKPKVVVNKISQQLINGVVTDKNGVPLPGANIFEKGTSNGTTADFDGNFSISVSGADAILVISYIGYTSKEVKSNTETILQIILDEDVANLDEVVIVGYGSQKKSDVISSVVTVKSEELNKTPSSDIGEMLRGKASGVLITTADSSPGSTSNIQIRGKRSITGGNSPLVIVDGVQVSSINDVGSNDIASMEILKDAAAQAIYGARASNGVILITTKRGKEGKLTVQYNGYYGVQTVQEHFDVYSGEEFADYRREAFRADNNDVFLPDEAIFSDAELQSIANGDYIDWRKEILRVAPITNHSISLSAGSENFKVYGGINYLNQQGVVKGTGYDRALVRLNADYNIKKWLKIGINSSWEISNKNNPGSSNDQAQGNMLVRALSTSPLGQIYNEDGSYKIHPGDVQDSFNPLLDLIEVSNKTDINKTIMNVFLDVFPTEGLRYRFNASRTYLDSKNQVYNSSKSLIGINAGGNGKGFLDYANNEQWQLENIFTYDSNLKNDKHKLNLTFVQSLISSKQSNFFNVSTNFPNDNIGVFGLASAEINQPSLSASERKLLSFAGRAQYDFSGKYYVTASVRADGSSVFGANNKWGYFPAAALGWNLDKEDFILDSKVINVLKLRTSYGSVGNEGIEPYQSLSTANQFSYLFNGNKTFGVLPGEFLPNPDLKWETTTTFNVALDYGLFDNKVNGSLEFYNSRTKDLLVDRALPGATGYTTIKTNIGEIENKGIELYLNFDIVDTEDFSLSTSLTYNRNKNKILSLYGIDGDGDGREDDDIENNWFIGQPIDVYYQFQNIGIWQEGDDIAGSNTPGLVPGDIRLYDRDSNDGLLNENDKVITKKDPSWYGTFALNMNYKDFDFGMTFYNVNGRTIENPFLNNYWYGGSLRGILSGIKQNYWTPENPTGDRPRPKESNNREFLDFSGLQDASFFRLQNVTLGYSLPTKVLDKLKMQKLRLYITGQNLYTITDFESFGPENDPTSYPETVSVVGGIQIAF